MGFCMELIRKLKSKTEKGIEKGADLSKKGIEKGRDRDQGFSRGKGRRRQRIPKSKTRVREKEARRIRPAKWLIPRLWVDAWYSCSIWMPYRWIYMINNIDSRGSSRFVARHCHTLYMALRDWVEVKRKTAIANHLAMLVSYYIMCSLHSRSRRKLVRRKNWKSFWTTQNLGSGLPKLLGLFGTHSFWLMVGWYESLNFLMGQSQWQW